MSTYVFGHRSPDTDSICSAIAYAYLKNLSSPGHVAARLGPINRESAFVLDTFRVPPPLLLPHVYIRASDIMTAPAIAAGPGDTLFDALRQIESHSLDALPVVDGEGRPHGILSARRLASRALLDRTESEPHPIRLGTVARLVNGTIPLGDPEQSLTGRTVVPVSGVSDLGRTVRGGDIVLCGALPERQAAAIRAGAALLVLVEEAEPDEEILALAAQAGTAILCSPRGPLDTAWLIDHSLPVESLMAPDPLRVSPDTKAIDLTPDLLATRHGLALVVKEDDGRLVGVVSQGDLLRRRRQKVVLVDHSERGQTADGIERCEIVEIIDHHRLGGLETNEPLFALIAPVGCTATLVLRRYREEGVEPPREMAGLMLSAILSDTVLLKSPTTTAEDVAAIEALGPLAGVEPLEFGREMVGARIDLDDMSDEALATHDQKRFVFGDQIYLIGQIEVPDSAPVLARREGLLAAMAQQRGALDKVSILLMVSDIFDERTDLLVTGDLARVERAFDTVAEEGILSLPGVLSRKKQVVPPIAALFRS